MRLLDTQEQADALAMVLLGAGTIEEVAAMYDTDPDYFMHPIYPEPTLRENVESTCSCRECTQ